MKTVMFLLIPCIILTGLIEMRGIWYLHLAERAWQRGLYRIAQKMQRAGYALMGAGILLLTGWIVQSVLTFHDQSSQYTLSSLIGSAVVGLCFYAHRISRRHRKVIPLTKSSR